jgi:hypothetical protein
VNDLAETTKAYFGAKVEPASRVIERPFAFQKTRCGERSRNPGKCIYWQHSQTDSWHIAAGYAVHNQAISLPREGNHFPVWASFNFRDSKFALSKAPNSPDLFNPGRWRLAVSF